MKIEDVNVGDEVIIRGKVVNVRDKMNFLVVIELSSGYIDTYAPCDIELATPKQPQPRKNLIGTLKTPMEILGVDLRSFTTPDNAFYTKDIHKNSGKKVTLKHNSLNEYDYTACTCDKDEGMFWVKKEWLKDIHEEFYKSSLKVDDRVWVREFGEEWEPRYFSHFDGNDIYCFIGGRTSFTITATNYWPDWQPYVEGVNPNDPPSK